LLQTALQTLFQFSRLLRIYFPVDMPVDGKINGALACADKAAIVSMFVSGCGAFLPGSLLCAGHVLCFLPDFCIDNTLSNDRNPLNVN
jgi:hypothetical protein